MDVLVNGFDTPLCAAAQPSSPAVRSRAATLTVVLALLLPPVSWAAAAISWPVHSDAFVIGFLAAHALALGLAVFSLGRAFVDGQKGVAVGAAVAALAAFGPILMVLSVLTKIRIA